MSGRQLRLKLTALIISVCIGLVLCELLLRYLYPQTLSVWVQTRDGLILLRPSSSFYLPKFGTHVETNSMGFRDVEHDLQNKNDAYRILLLGDSFMEALQVEFEKSFPHLLEEDLNKRLGCRVEVISAGVSGWGTDDEVTFLFRKGKNLQPDLVLFAITLHNDISDNLEERYHVLEEGKLRPKPVQETPLLRHIILEVRSYLVSHSHAYQLIYQRWKSLGSGKAGGRLTEHVLELMRKEPSTVISKGWDMTKQLLAEAYRLSKIQSAEMAVFSVPLVYQADSRAYAELLAAYHMSERKFDPDKPREMLMQILDEENIHRIDIFPEFLHRVQLSGKQDLYIQSDGHWNEIGHQIAASVVSAQVGEIILHSRMKVSHCRT